MYLFHNYNNLLIFDFRRAHIPSSNRNNEVSSVPTRANIAEPQSTTETEYAYIDDANISKSFNNEGIDSQNGYNNAKSGGPKENEAVEITADTAYYNIQGIKNVEMDGFYTKLGPQQMNKDPQLYEDLKINN